MGAHCAPNANGFVEWLQHERAAVSACKRLTDGNVLRAIDLASGLLAEGGSQDPSITRKVLGALSANVRHDQWVQLAPNLVRDEGVLVTIDDEEEAYGGGEGHALLFLLLVLLCIVWAVPGVIYAMHLRKRVVEEHGTEHVSTSGGLIGAMCAAACEGAEEHLAPVLPAAFCDWWRDRMKPRGHAAVETVRGWTPRVFGQMAVPVSERVGMMAAIDEDEDGETAAFTPNEEREVKFGEHA